MNKKEDDVASFRPYSIEDGIAWHIGPPRPEAVIHTAKSLSRFGGMSHQAVLNLLSRSKQAQLSLDQA